MRHPFKSFFYILLFSLLYSSNLFAQTPYPALVGYWHNWNDGSAPYIPLDQIDSRYNVVNLAFAVPGNGTDYDMEFVLCCGETQAGLISKIQTLQGNGVVVNISIGGATAQISLDNDTEKNTFISSMNAIINTYGFNGIDVDLEGSSLAVNAASTIANPTDIPVINMIDAIQQIATDFQSNFGTSIFLSTAPETAFVQGGQSAWGGIWGAYLPLIDALRNDWDLIHVQLYNSGSMYGIDGNIYAQGSADFIISMVEAMIQGFDVDQWNNQAGTFNGFSESLIAIGLPACPSAAGGGFTSTTIVESAINYIRGTGPQPGSYQLQGGPYPGLAGMMTWSINWDAVGTCNSSSYEFAQNFEDIFQSGGCVQPDLGADVSSCGISFPFTLNSNTSPNTNVTYTWTNVTTGQTLVSNSTTANTLSINAEGTYRVTRDSSGCSKNDEVKITNDLEVPALPTSLNLCETVPEVLNISNSAAFPVGTSYSWYKDGALISGQNGSVLLDIRSPGTYKIIANYSTCSKESELAVTSSLPEPIDGCMTVGNAVSLSINPVTSGPFKWYESSAGGVSLATGTNFTTPILNSTATYYVEDESSVGSATTGPPATGNGLGAIQSWQSPTEITFDVTSTIVLKELTLYPLIWCSTHTLTFQIQNSAGTVLTNGTQSFSITDDDANCSTVMGAVTLTLSNGGVTIPVGTGYKIVSTGSIGINFWTGSVSFPMNYSPYFEITNSNVAGNYMAVHDWVVDGGACARMPVIAEIDPGCSSVLPIELIYFDAKVIGRKVQLNWETNIEINNHGFHILKSQNGLEFESIGWLNAGENEFNNFYEFVDENIKTGQLYFYKLEQIDLNGNSIYSPIRTIEIPQPASFFEVFPNPFKDELNISLSGINEAGLLQIFDSRGILIFEKEIANNENKITLNNLPSGILMISFFTNGKRYIKQVFRKM